METVEAQQFKENDVRKLLHSFIIFLIFKKVFL